MPHLGLRMHCLWDNWEPLLDRNQYGDKTIGIMREFQQQLKDLSNVSDDRNKKRKISMEAFNPIKMESSVSV